MAPGLSSGLFWLPHFGDCTHDGQPSVQAHDAIASRVARSQAAAAWKPRSAKPAPPGCPSWTKTVSRPVSGCSAVETPPMSQRSQVANSGSSPIEACSAAWAAPGRSASATPDSVEHVVGQRPPDRGRLEHPLGQVERLLADHLARRHLAA